MGAGSFVVSGPARRSRPPPSASVRCGCDPAAQGRGLLRHPVHNRRPQALAARIMLGGVPHAVTLAQLFDAHVRERRSMEEHIVLPGVRLNEAKAPLANGFDRAFYHGCSPSSCALKRTRLT